MEVSRVGYAARTFLAGTEHGKGTRGVPYQAASANAGEKPVAVVVAVCAVKQERP